MTSASTGSGRPDTDPYWWEAQRPEATTDDLADELPDRVDVLVVGAGLTGASAARTLAKNGASVLMIDAEAPGHGASSRNGGMVGTGYRLSLDQLTERYGAETARTLLREAHIDSLDFVKALIRDEAIDCDFDVTGRFSGQRSAAVYEETARSFERLQTVVPIRWEMIPRDRQRAEIGTDFYHGGLLLPDHAALHPAKYHAGLLKAALRAGARVRGHTPMTGIRRTGAGFTVQTPRGVVQASDVLMATNGYTTAAMRSLQRRIVPVRSYVATTEPLSANLLGALMPGRRMIVETRNRHCYYRLSPDGTRLVFGARAALSQIPQASATRIIHGLIQEIFPDIGPVRLTHSWSGRLGFSFAMMPHVGRIDGVWHAMGFSGSGNTMAPYLGHKAALSMLGSADGETAYAKTDFPTRFWHFGPPWFLPFADAKFRMLDLRDDLQRTG